VVRLLVCDDAPQFTLVTEELALCWVHEGRHYKKLMPTSRAIVRWWRPFVQRFWTYYDQLLAIGSARRRRRRRDRGGVRALFATITGYDALDERIAKTQAKERLPPHGAHAPEIPSTTTGRTGSARTSAQTGCELRAAHPEGAKAWDTS